MASKGKKQKREREPDELQGVTMTMLPDPNETASLMVETAKVEAAAAKADQRPAKRQKSAWQPPPEGTTLFQISMEKMNSKPIKGKKMRQKLDNLLTFGDPDQTLLEEKQRVQSWKKWHKEVEVRKKSHRQSKKARMEAWKAANDSAKALQDKRMGTD